MKWYTEIWEVNVLKYKETKIKKGSRSPVLKGKNNSQ